MSKVSNLLLIIAVAAAVGGVYWQSHYEGQQTVPQNPLGYLDLDLVNEDGESVTLKNYQGKWLLVFFGYRSCPDVCPMTLSYLNREWKDLAAIHDQLEILYVSVDPRRDTPANLKEYVHHFNPRFHGLTSSEENLQALIKALGGYYSYDNTTETELGYLVEHSASLYLLNPDGKLQETIRPPHGKGELVRTMARVKDGILL